MRLCVSSLGRIFNRDLPIEFGSETLSSYGGLELLRRYFQLIGLHRRIRRAFADHDLGGDYGCVRLVLLVIGLLVVGAVGFGIAILVSWLRPAPDTAA